MNLDLTAVLDAEINEYAEYIRNLSHSIIENINSPKPSPVNIQIATDELAGAVKGYLLSSYSR